MRRRRISLALAAFLWILAVPRTVETFSSLLFCKCVVFNATSGVFQTPNYPRAVSKGTCYLYHFAAPPQHTVRIRFDTFELEKRQAKCVDYVRIFEKTADGEIDDDSPHDGEYCGDEITPNAYFLSSTNHMILYINIEIGADSRGFRGHYQFIPNEKYEMNAIELSPCEFTANTFRGSLFSPRAPYYYLSNTVCTYHVPPRRLHVARIRLIFLEFPHNSCDLHFLKISEMKPKVGQGVLLNGGRGHSSCVDGVGNHLKCPKRWPWPMGYRTIQ
ncbi:hypothetical protein L596_008028 [Steinernema carpocapsae]|uniref:CUB domain-containing protein n=2 Tax=Steinernema carpocapsae TaxID=34508 RepID=A0A4U5PBI3_STECR|nr:hypothetical protein L596_008028 [Steinernema carpocapsae]